MPRSAVLLSLILSMVAPVAAVQADDARTALDRFADGLVALEGRFEQQVFNGDGSLRETASGTVALQAPRLFRWHYLTPYEQLVVADGSHVWLHDVDLEQVTVRRQADQEAESPLVVLTDPASLDRRYRVEEAGRRDGLDWLALFPLEAEDAGFRQARLAIGADGLERMELEDSLGGRTEIRFSDWRRNPPLDAARFRFLPPEGVDLIGDVDSVPEIRPLDSPRP
jgi:outer membrane lipoprotein carrier protein